jgi:hypothetical protein
MHSKNRRQTACQRATFEDENDNEEQYDFGVAAKCSRSGCAPAHPGLRRVRMSRSASRPVLPDNQLRRKTDLTQQLIPGRQTLHARAAREFVGHKPKPFLEKSRRLPFFVSIKG